MPFNKRKCYKNVGCFSCEQVRFLSTPMLTTQQTKRGQKFLPLWQKNSEYSQLYNVFLNDLTLQRQLTLPGESGVAGILGILNFDITIGSPGRRASKAD